MMIRLYFFAAVTLMTSAWVKKQPEKQKTATMQVALPKADSAARPPAALGQLKWKFKTGGKLSSSPTLANGRLYIGSEEKKIYAIDSKTGTITWSFETTAPIKSAVAVSGNTLYAISAAGIIYAIDCNTGKLQWKFKTNGEKSVGGKNLWGMLPAGLYMNDPYDLYTSSPVVQVNAKMPAVYFGSADGYLYALNATNGELKWKFKTGGIIRSTPALDQNKIYVGSWDSYFYALDQETGKLTWKFKTGDDKERHLMEGFQATAVVKNGQVYIGCRDGFFYALDSANGTMKWRYDAHGSWIVSTAAVNNGTVYATTSDSYLFVALDAGNGTEKYQLKTCGYNFSSPAIAGNNAFFGDFSGQFYAVDLLTGRVNSKFETPARKKYKGQILDGNGNLNFQHTAANKSLMYYQTSLDVMDQFYKLGPIIAAPVVADGLIYFGSTDGCLYAIDLKK
jgi:outer membrane protein assembly factor BamB